LPSCQKEAISNQESIASKANSSAKNPENDVPFPGYYITTAQFPFLFCPGSASLAVGTCLPLPNFLYLPLKEHSKNGL
jgi:hypothetical protein